MMSMPREVFGTCPHDCPDTCSFVSQVSDGRATQIEGNAAHPVTQGWLCGKVNDYLNHVYDPQRLTHPMRRVGAKGSQSGSMEGAWQRISWEEAIDEVADRWRLIIDRYGAAAILPYSATGTLGLVQMTVASARLWNWLGASQLQRSICGAAAEFAVRATVGGRHSPAYSDVSHSRLVLLWGTNPASTGPHFLPFLKKAQRNGTQVVVIDPLRTRTALGADLHLAPVPGTDAALALGLGHVMVAAGLHDEDWLQQNTVGWPALKERLEAYPPDRVAAICGLKEDSIVQLAHLYATLRPGLIKIGDGVQRHLTGGQTVRAIATLPALTGQYGIAGGGLDHSASDVIRWDKEAVNHWGECPPPARVVNMNRLGAALLGEVQDPPIQSLFVFGANPAVSTPNAGKVAAGLLRPDLFTVVHDLFLTDTADYADIVLPATSQLEQTDLHKPYGFVGLGYNAPAIAPLGESKSNWEVMGLLARAMGCDRPWMYQTPDEVIEEVLAATAAHNPLLQGVTLAQLKSQGFVLLDQWTEVPFADSRFPTSSGKVELYSSSMEAEGLEPLPDWTERLDYDPPGDQSFDADPGPLNLICGGAHNFISSSFAGRSSCLRYQGMPRLEIHPWDAAARNLEDGMVVIVENGRGWCRLLAVITDGVRPGVVASPKGHWSKLDPWREADGGRNVNWTTSDALADMAGQSTFHSNQVWVRPAKPR